jgi:DNA-binding beta-propeller fold protein YncE
MGRRRRPGYSRREVNVLLALALAACRIPAVAVAVAPTRVDLPSSKQISAPVPGDPHSTNSFPTAIAVSPDGNYAALLANGRGASESGYHQSIAVLDLKTGALVDYPDARLAVGASQTYFLGLAFSHDGKTLFASMASLSDPEGTRTDDTGDGIAAYAFANGVPTPASFARLPLRPLAAGQVPTSHLDGVDDGHAVSYPAGIAVLPGNRLLVAENLADDAVVLDAKGAVQARFELGKERVPGTYPYGAVATRDGKRGWISLWNASAVAELDLVAGKVVRTIPLLAPAVPTSAGSHPSAMLLSVDEKRLYVTLSNADALAVVDLATHGVATWSTRLPGMSDGGTTPDAIAETADGKHIFVADASADTVAVFDAAGKGEALGFIPTEWYPTALAVAGGDLLVATGKGRGTGPNSGPGEHRAHPYIASLIHGSVARVPIEDALSRLDSLTAAAREDNLLTRDAASIAWSGGKNPIRHVVYIIKENRAYDQIFGDLGVGDGDPSLVLYGEEVTPNEHALARRFGVLDNFYCSGEVSGNGHVWSTAAITSDYTEKTWQIAYRGDERFYDYEGEDQSAVPLEHGMPDVDEPGTGYLWANADSHGVTHRNYGEYVLTRWCDEPETLHSAAVAGTPLSGQAQCPKAWVEPGEAIAGAPNPWPWRIPVPGVDVATKPELRGNFDPKFADFRLDYPDQLRADEFLRELAGWTTSAAMPGLVILRLPNDHTSGTMPGKATPSAAVADNDLAVGRVVDAISHSFLWDDTAIVVLEDDAQDGADHVDAHRSPALVISKYAPIADEPVVDSTFYTTVSAIHTVEALLGLPPMNQNDASAPLIALFSGPGTAPPFDALTRNRDNQLIYQVNPKKAQGGSASSRMDFSRADDVDTAALNAILWRDRWGDRPMPPPVHAVFPGND